MANDAEELIKKGLRARRENRLADAKRDFAQAVDVSRRSGLRIELARALSGLGQIERDLGNADPAIQHYEEAVSIFRSVGTPLKLAHTIRHLADIHREARHYESADAVYTEALALYREHPEAPQLDLANALRGWAVLKDHMGHVVEARALWQEARDLYAGLNLEAGVAESTRRLSALHGTVSDSPQS